MSAIDIFVLPTANEGFCRSILEAMASGTPVVGSKKGGIPLAVKNNINGFLVRSKSSKAIADAVNKILNNPALKEKLGQGARKTVVERFDWGDIAKRYEHLSLSAIKAHRRMKKIIDDKFSMIDIS